MATIAIVIVIAFLATVAAFVVLRARPRDDTPSGPQVTDTDVRPAGPGEAGAPPDERPTPGSSADRRRHGKP